MEQSTFDQRLTRIETRHGQLAVGVSYKIGPDGLIHPVPHRRLGSRFPFRALLLLFVLGYAFKAALFVGLGEGVYVTRLDILKESGPVGQASAWVMQPDPVVRTAAELAAGAPLVWLNLN
jgi:hypothetical protein